MGARGERRQTPHTNLLAYHLEVGVKVSVRVVVRARVIVRARVMVLARGYGYVR